MRIYPLGDDKKIKIPEDWASELGLRDSVSLEKTPEGILVRPVTSLSWEELFAEKLSTGSQGTPDETLEVNKDDLLF